MLLLPASFESKKLYFARGEEGGFALLDKLETTSASLLGCKLLKMFIFEFSKN